MNTPTTTDALAGQMNAHARAHLETHLRERGSYVDYELDGIRYRVFPPGKNSRYTFHIVCQVCTTAEGAESLAPLGTIKNDAPPLWDTYPVYEGIAPQRGLGKLTAAIRALRPAGQ